MKIEIQNINKSLHGTTYEQFLLDLNQRESLDKNINTIFEKLVSYFDLDVRFIREEDLYLDKEDDLQRGYEAPNFLESQSVMQYMPIYEKDDLNVQDFYIHETGHMIDYYLIQQLIKDDTENYSIHDAKLQDFIKQTIIFYDNNALPKPIVDYFTNSVEYKTDSTKKYIYEGLSDIITLITKGKYFNKSYHEVMDVSQWNPNRFLIYGHDIEYLKQLKDNETEIEKIIKEIFANYISICLLPNKEAYDLLKEIKNDKGENLQDVMNSFIADTVKKL